jgi:hypothetical protein
MKALTLWQPWASLIAIGAKRVETRCWTTKYRGELAIHSAGNMPPNWLGASRHQAGFRDELAEVLNSRRDRDDRNGFRVDDAVRKLPFGKVLCIVRLQEIIPTALVRDEVSQRDRIFGNYEEGRYAWFLELKEVFDLPIPAKGSRMLWNWSR